MQQQQQQDYDYIMKTTLVGSTGVGKSSLLLRYMDNTFNHNGYITTIGVDFRVRTININDRNVKQQIWDTAGKERFRTITTAYLRGALGLILIYDISNEQSFQFLKQQWENDIQPKMDHYTQVMVLGNKDDLEDHRQVKYEQGEQFAQSIGALQFFEVSAKTGQNVDKAFIKFSESIDENKDIVQVFKQKNEERRNNQIRGLPQQQNSFCKC